MPYFAFSTIQRIVVGGRAGTIGQVQQKPSEPAYGVRRAALNWRARAMKRP
jgi:hypothetical protein